MFCSPLIRTRQTLENLGVVSKNIIFDERLKERNYGEFEKTPKSSFNYNEFWNLSKNKHYVKAECCKEFFDRVVDFIEEVKEKYADQNVLVVTHAGITKVFEWYFNGFKDEEIGPYLPNNCDVLKYEFEK